MEKYVFVVTERAADDAEYVKDRVVGVYEDYKEAKKAMDFINNLMKINEFRVKILKLDVDDMRKLAAAYRNYYKKKGMH